MPETSEILRFTVAEAAARPWVLGFVYRHDRRGGEVVLELPELRPSIQIMLADDYWLRERGTGSTWVQAPRMAFWGPRLNWGYGFAAHEVRAFGIGLTARGAQALFGHRTASFVDRVVDVAALNGALAQVLGEILTQGGPDDWQRAAELAIARIAQPAPADDPLDPSLAILAEDGFDAVRRAALAVGLGERQFRRAFRSQYGFSPRQYRRVLRVDRLMRQLHPRPWEVDAHESELAFADQPHMIREFKALTGVTPAVYARTKRRLGDATIRSVTVGGVAPPQLTPCA